MKDHGSFGDKSPSPAKNFSVGDVVVRVTESLTLKRGGLYTVADAWVAVGPFSDGTVGAIPAIELAEAPTQAMNAQITPLHPYRGRPSWCFRLAFTPDPDVARERTDLSEPAQPKTHAGERARKRVGANQGANQ